MPMLSNCGRSSGLAHFSRRLVNIASFGSINRGRSTLPACQRRGRVSPNRRTPLRAGDGRLKLADAGWVMPLDERRIRLAQDIGADDGITAGVRPEHMRLQRDGHGAFRASVQYCEPRGDADFVVVAPLEDRATTITAEAFSQHSFAIDLGIRPKQRRQSRACPICNMWFAIDAAGNERACR